MMKKFILTITVVMLFEAHVKGQDHHLSNYDVASLYLNPATTGMFRENEYRITADQRGQWRSLGIKPFMTSYLSYDRACDIKGRDVGMGAYLVNNNAGLGGFNTFSFLLSSSYDILHRRYSGAGTRPKIGTGNVFVPLAGQGRERHSLRVGLQLGLMYRSSAGEQLVYDSQYDFAHNGGSFNQGLSSNEESARMNITRFDANYGLYYQYFATGRTPSPFLGFSMSHLTRPDESLTGDVNRMPIAFRYHGGCHFRVGKTTDLTPRFFVISQAKARAVSTGLLVGHELANADLFVSAGVDYRWKDACVFSFGISQGDYGLRVAYDLNTSYLRNYTNGRGAFELALIYARKKGPPRPVFGS